MAHLGKFGREADPWRSTRFISATIDLFLSVLLLLAVAISLAIAQFVHFFGLQPPCVRIGCPCHSAPDEAVHRCTHCQLPGSRPVPLAQGLGRKRSYAVKQDAFVAVSPVGEDRDSDDDHLPLSSARCISFENIDADKRDSEPWATPAETARRECIGCREYHSTGGIDLLSEEARAIDQVAETGVRCSTSNSARVSFGKMQHVRPVKLDLDNRESLGTYELCKGSPLEPKASHNLLKVHLETTQEKRLAIIGCDKQIEQWKEESLHETEGSIQASSPSKQLAMQHSDGWLHDIEDEGTQSSHVSEQKRRTDDVKLKLIDEYLGYSENEHQDVWNAASSVIDREDADQLKQRKNNADEHGAKDEHGQFKYTVLSILQCKAQQEEEEDMELETDTGESVEALRKALQQGKKILAALEKELENEKNAAAIATQEAMAMILRLQEEKSAMQVEVEQLQRMSEEKAEYDEEAMELLKEILLKREREKIALEKEVAHYRGKLQSDQVGNRKRGQSSKEMDWEATEKAIGPVELFSGRHGQDPSSAEHMGEIRLSNQINARSNELSLTAGVPQKMEEIAGASDGLWRNLLEPADDKETQFVLGHTCSLEKLQDLHQKDRLATGRDDIILHHSQSLDLKLMRKNAESNSGVLWMKNDDELEEYGDKAEIDPVASGENFPVHDVYEVQCASEVELKEIEECHNASEDCQERSPEWLSQEHKASKYCRRKSVLPPRFPVARQLFAQPKQMTPDQNQSLISQTSNISKGNPMEVEAIHVRLEALEADRELIREALWSFKRSDEEHKLLQEIMQHLKQLAKSESL